MKKFVLRMKKTGHAKIDVQRRYFGFLWISIAHFNGYYYDHCGDGEDKKRMSDYLADAERRARAFMNSYCDIRGAERLAAKREKELQKRLKTPIVMKCDHVNNV